MTTARYLAPVLRTLRLALLPVLLLLLAGLIFPSASAQSAVRRLTGTGDVMTFSWSSSGNALYVTRSGAVLPISPTIQQTTGNLYRVPVTGGAAFLLARSANDVTSAPSANALAFVRLNSSGSSQLIRLDPATTHETLIDTVPFNTQATWNKTGDTLYYARGAAIARATNSALSTSLQDSGISPSAVVSPLGDRAANVTTAGLLLTQNSGTRLLVANTNGARVLPTLVWSNTGDKLAYIVTHDGLNPELWLADTTHNNTTRLAQGQLETFADPAWSPDDAYIVFTRTPSGSSAVNSSELWRASTNSSNAIRLTHNGAEETLPQYSPDGRSLAFLRGGDVWVIPLNAQGLPQVPDTTVSPAPVNPKAIGAASTPRTPPSTIRVRHDAANSCRSVPLGQIDTLDFETYVARVVPAEVFSSWAPDALKTQAVAARSFAWFWILQHGSSDYDVTDTTAYQYMCDTRVSSTDNATQATRGQYLDYQGNLVFAAFGAENGDPTLTNTWSNPYLLAVDDPVGFQQTRAGNGLGMSQWGAQRWASQYGWNYQQILLHYYSNVTVQLPAGNGPDTTAPLGAVLAPWSNWGVTSNQVRFFVNATDDNSGIASIDLNAQYLLNGSPHSQIIATLNGAAREYIWDVSALANQTNVIVTPLVRDVSGNSATGAGVTFNLDRKNPQGSLTAPSSTTTKNITLNLSASDSGGSGLTGMSFSNNWNWEGEAQSITANSGTVVSDPDALNGTALRGLLNFNSAGAWYGPYTTVLPVNQAYRAYFRLKTDNVLTTAPVALLDVANNGGADILGVKTIRGTDFATAGAYQEFYVDFYYTGSTSNGLEFRVTFTNAASLWLDRILAVSYPIPYTPSAPWTLSSGSGTKQVFAKFTDGAGNISADATATIFFGASPTPTPSPTPAPHLTPRVYLPFLEYQK